MTFPKSENTYPFWFGVLSQAILGGLQRGEIKPDSIMAQALLDTLQSKGGEFPSALELEANLKALIK